ncbi:extracellular solute-binding protein [Paenibacillus ginsengarvi]|uniref:Extracellular solute-binding protein n=1 Tax=Paenibacillus ginsengarvi TaxID=400777 RepID=A0A3B0AQI7_9BACL|nr:extracellular solute-binding protein [Paenibacillus ginsengarvi]RKN62872.1 extracellular solute-binding protein [Paenibacillus ginsengarvi]
MKDTSPDKPSRKTFDTRLQRMIDRIRSDIWSGVYGPGDFLPAEKSLTEQFELSNKSVRKGLESLVAEGLIVKIDRVGSRVTDHVPGGATITLGYTHSIERDIALSALLDDFQSLHPYVRVKTLEIKSVSSYIATATEYMDNGLVDVFTLNNQDFQNIVDSGERLRLDRLPPDPGLYRFAQAAFECEGELHARPLVFSPIILAYNRAHFRESGVPEPDGSWTWEDAVRHAAQLTKPGIRHGLYFYLLSDNRWPAFLLQSGERFRPEPDGRLRLAGSRLLDSVRLCRSLIANRDIFPNYLSENSDDVNELFMQGKVSMIMTNYMTINDFKNTDLDYDISPLPYLYEPRSLMNVIGAAVSAKSRHPEAARQLADYFASPRAQKLIRERTLSLPAHKETAELPGYGEDGMNRPSRYSLFREIMASYRLHRELGLTTSSFSAFRQLLKKYCSGLIDEEELCRQASALPFPSDPSALSGSPSTGGR